MHISGIAAESIFFENAIYYKRKIYTVIAYACIICACYFYRSYLP